MSTSYTMSVPNLPVMRDGARGCRLYKKVAGQEPEVIGTTRVSVSGTEVYPDYPPYAIHVRVTGSDGRVYEARHWDVIRNELVADAFPIDD